MKIFVDNLSQKVTENDLQRLFEEWGEVDLVTIIKDQKFGQPLGIVKMQGEAEAVRAIKISTVLNY